AGRPGGRRRRAACTCPRPSRGVRGTRPGASAPAPAGGVPGMLSLSSLPHGDTNFGKYSTSPVNRGATPRMLTPAEELGLSGHSLAGRVRKAFYQVPEATLVELMRQLRAEALRRHLIYLRDGQPDAVRVLPCPVTVLPDQLAYIHYVSLTIHNALKRLPELYFQDFGVRDVLR